MTWLVATAVVAVVGAWCRPVTVDEAWSTVVARRVAGGEKLYRDVFYGAGPGAILLLSLAVRLTKRHALVARLFTVGYVLAAAASVLVLVDDPDGQMMGIASIAALGSLHLHLHNHYSSLSTVSAMWSLAAVQADLPWLAGSLAGVALLGKYSVGIVAVVVVVVSTGLLDSLEAVGTVVATAVLAPAVTAVLGRRLVRWFYRRAVANKAGYLEFGRAGPIRWIRTRNWRRPDLVALQVPVVIAIVAVVVVPLATLGALAADVSEPTVIGCALSIVGLSVVVPRFDGGHAMTASTPVVIGFAISFGTQVWAEAVGIIAWLMTLVGVAGRVSWLRKREVRRDVVGFDGLAAPRVSGGVWPDETAGLPDEVFLLRLDAPLVYATRLVSNPTPFDYPAVTTFGPNGFDVVRRAHRKGLAVCVRWANQSSPLTPRGLVDEMTATAGERVALGKLVAGGR